MASDHSDVSKEESAELASSTEDEQPKGTRRSTRKKSPNKRFSQDFLIEKLSKTGSSRRQAKKITNVSDEESSEEDSYKQDSNIEILEKEIAAILFEEQTDVPGVGIYGFQTPKKRGSMSALAHASAQRTPGSQSGSSMSHTVGSNIPKTPMHLRCIAKKEMQKALHAAQGSDFSASESEYSPLSDEDEHESDSDGPSSSEEDSGDDTASEKHSVRSGMSRKSIPDPVHFKRAIPAKLSSQLPSGETSATPRRSGRRANADSKPELQYIVQSDDYFSTFASAKSVTSDHTLDRLNTPRLPQDVLFRLLEETNASRSHTDAIQELLEGYEQQFAHWLLLLDQGFNVLLYGLGSKRSLLQSFHRQSLADHSVLVVNGFFPGLTVKDVLDGLAGDLLEIRQTSSHNHEAIDGIERQLACQPHLHVFLLVHNLDGVAMRNERMQSTISRLASIPNVHLVASIDHINAPLLWDASKLSLFNFCWWDVTTMLPYTTETAFENSLLVQNAGALALSSMRSVVASLTSNARGIFMMIVQHQLANGGPANPQHAGMLLKDLYWSCREAFLVSSDIALRAQLTEFTDHKLLRIKRTADGAETLHIPIEHGLLQRFFDESSQN
ncbi:origin recognition complex subunit 2 [Anopheles nili]|uniref:origin recognition complex subunit 2 n=1 Tax=Anopheles nili TaxID=185578 RepID=UPI00237A96CE|nr:origin recognition complex subunit 2 [Anopheles nili]